MPAVIIAHRTCPRYAPENSLEGIRTAAKLGADGVEIDVQRTLDGVPILMHDRTLWRTAGLYCPARLLPHTLVRRLRLKRSSERVPTLAEALAALPAGLAVAIDIKHASAAAATLAEVRRQRLEGPPCCGPSPPPPSATRPGQRRRSNPPSYATCDGPPDCAASSMTLSA